MNIVLSTLPLRLRLNIEETETLGLLSPLPRSFTISPHSPSMEFYEQLVCPVFIPVHSLSQVSSEEVFEKSFLGRFNFPLGLPLCLPLHSALQVLFLLELPLASPPSISSRTDVNALNSTFNIKVKPT